MIPVFIGVSIITYYVGSATGNPLDIIRFSTRNPNPATLHQLAVYYGLDKPWYDRYFIWLWNFFHGNFGTGFVYANPNQLISGAITATLELQFLAIIFSLVIGIPVGVFSALKQYSKADVGVTTFAIFGVSMPTFWLGIMAITVFSYYLGWFPAGGALSSHPPYWWGSPFLDRIAHLILPTAVLTYVELALIVRLVRASMLETLRQDYILAARASGFKERVVVFKYALKNAITPVVTVTGLGIALSLGGAPATETVFGWPGLGYYFVQAALFLDLPTVQAITVLIAIMALFANLLTDIAYGVIDPRVRLS